MNKRIIGISLVLAAAISWGVSGTVAQYLFQYEQIGVEWLVVIRLLFAGAALLLFTFAKGNSHIYEVLKDRNSLIRLIIFGIFGMLGVQYTYFAAIYASNAATATLLQYLAPVMIAIYLALKQKSLPSRLQGIALFLALLGTFFLVTSGQVQQLSISAAALMWGLASAFALAFYTLFPIKLLNTYGSAAVVGWGMLIGGIGLSVVQPPWDVSGNISLTTLLGIIFVIFFGTLVAFFCYLESLKYLKATETSLLACAEPLSAAVLAVLWLNVPFGLFEWLGALCIIATIVLLSREKKDVIEFEDNGVEANESRKMESV